MSAIEVVLFDIDGLLVGPPGRQRQGAGFSRSLETDCGTTRVRTQPFFEGPFRRCLKGEADLATELEPLLGDWGWAGTVAEFIEYWLRSDALMEPAALALREQLRRRGILAGSRRIRSGIALRTWWRRSALAPGSRSSPATWA